MKTVDVAGIPFTEKMLTELKSWIVPSQYDDACISADINTLNNTSSFLLHHWEDSLMADSEIKEMLIGISHLKCRLDLLNTIKVDDVQKGGQS